MIIFSQNQMDEIRRNSTVEEFLGDSSKKGYLLHGSSVLINPPLLPRALICLSNLHYPTAVWATSSPALALWHSGILHEILQLRQIFSYDQYTKDFNATRLIISTRRDGFVYILSSEEFKKNPYQLYEYYCKNPVYPLAAIPVEKNDFRYKINQRPFEWFSDRRFERSGMSLERTREWFDSAKGSIADFLEIRPNFLSNMRR